MSKKSENLISSELRIFFVLGIVFATRTISSAMSHLLQLPTPITDGIGFFVVSIVLYWIPQVSKSKRFDIYRWLAISAIAAVVMSVVLHIVDRVLS